MRAETIEALESMGFKKSWRGWNYQMHVKRYEGEESGLHFTAEVTESEDILRKITTLRLSISLSEEDSGSIQLYLKRLKDVDGLDIKSEVEDGMKKVNAMLVEMAQIAARVAMTGI
jgi:hypothetical protein